MRKIILALATSIALLGSLVGAASSAAANPGALEGARNFRDIGGYTNIEGRTIRSGLVYRSNRLSALTDADVQRLADLNVTLVVDLRNFMERSREKDRLPATARYQRADVASVEYGLKFRRNATVTLWEAIEAGILNGTDNFGQTIGYPFMVSFVGAERAFGDLVRAVANNDTGATVYHCASGKDRTGWATAILLSILQVPMETIEADFLLSNERLGRPDAVELGWLRLAFTEVNKIWGSMESYVRNGLGVDDATVVKLRNKLLG